MIKNVVIIATVYLMINTALNAEVHNQNNPQKRDTSFDMKLHQNLFLAKDDAAFDVKPTALKRSSSKDMTNESFDLTSKKQFARAK